MNINLKAWVIFFVSTVVCAASLSDFSQGTAFPQDKVAASWFAGWHEKDFPPSNVPWEKYSHVFYAFANTSPNPAKLDESGLKGLPDFVSQARNTSHNPVKPILTVGGWTGSRFFSTAVGSASNRTAFVKAVTKLVTKYKVDGVQFDWEYPNDLGVGCNLRNINDTSNLLLFLQELRAHPVGKALSITAAVGIVPWLGPEGIPVTDVSEFAKVLDFVSIMNYDVWGSWSKTVGPNAPLNDTCAPQAYQMGSAVSALATWTKAGMPLNKIVLGVAAYGHSFRVRKQDAFVPGSTTELALYPPFNASAQPHGTKWDAEAGETDVCGVTSTTPGGIFEFSGMENIGYLDCFGNPKDGRIYKFDNCSKTPFIYDPENEVMVSYDDPQSMRAKGKFIKDENLKGFSLWETGGDYHTSLVDAIRSEI